MTSFAASVARPSRHTLLANSALSLLGRVGLATTFLFSGLAKLAAPGAALAAIVESGLPLPGIALLLALFVELIVSSALALGYHTRLAALVLAGFSVITAFTFHHSLSEQNQFLHFFRNLAISGGLLHAASRDEGKADAPAQEQPALMLAC